MEGTEDHFSEITLGLQVEEGSLLVFAGLTLNVKFHSTWIYVIMMYQVSIYNDQ